jgi:CheY-like chemotaxis protein
MKTAVATKCLQGFNTAAVQYATNTETRPARAIVANPDPVARSFHARSLSGTGIRVDEVSDGRGVIEAVDRGGVDIAIVSLFMPEVDGIETVRYLHRRHPEVRIVVLVNNSHPAFLELGRVASLLGAHQVLYEPFSTSRLVQAALRVQARKSART